MANAKAELREVVELLKAPDKFTRLGGEVPKGVLLVGARGTGKTLLAKAAAGEADVPFFSINGSEFIQLFVGVGASRVRDLFKTAKENAPCIIFIDEIDAVGRMRGAGMGGGSDEREQTLNQILAETDAFTPHTLSTFPPPTHGPALTDGGPALVTRHLPQAEKPMKVSIVPRGQTLGVNISVPEEERYHHGMDYFKNRLVMTLAGRAADRLVYGQPFAGAENDLRQATKLARYMVTNWGMSDRVGPISLHIGEEHVFLGKEIQQARDFSEGIAQAVDEEVQRLLREADDTAYRLLEEHRADLDRLARELLKREEMSRAEIEELLKEPASTQIRAAEPAVS